MTFRAKLAAAAAHLHCAVTPEAVRYACRLRAEAICRAVGNDLGPQDRLEALADHFSVEFHVARTTFELDERIHLLARAGNHGFALRRGRFDKDLLAAILRRPNPAAADRRFVALIDARNEKGPMAFFSKTHEVAHPALEPQLTFEYRDEGQKRDDWERLVDLVGAESVFDGDVWADAVRGCDFTISSLDQLRSSLAPDASFTAVALAAGNTLEKALLVVWAELGTSQRDPEPVLRLKNVTPNHVAAGTEAFLPRAFRVPHCSPISAAFQTGRDHAGEECLGDWCDSSGRALPARRVWTSATVRGSGVLGIVTLPSQ